MEQIKCIKCVAFSKTGTDAWQEIKTSSVSKCCIRETNELKEWRIHLLEAEPEYFITWGIEDRGSRLIKYVYEGDTEFWGGEVLLSRQYLGSSASIILEGTGPVKKMINSRF